LKKKLSNLKDKGIISEDEFEIKKETNFRYLKAK